MCESRFAVFSIAKHSDLTNASVPAGTLAPAGRRELGCAAMQAD